MFPFSSLPFFFTVLLMDEYMSDLSVCLVLEILFNSFMPLKIDSFDAFCLCKPLLSFMAQAVFKCVDSFVLRNMEEYTWKQEEYTWKQVWFCTYNLMWKLKPKEIYVQSILHQKVLKHQETPFTVFKPIMIYCWRNHSCFFFFTHQCRF